MLLRVLLCVLLCVLRCFFCANSRTHARTRTRAGARQNLFAIEPYLADQVREGVFGVVTLCLAVFINATMLSKILEIWTAFNKAQNDLDTRETPPCLFSCLCLDVSGRVLHVSDLSCLFQVSVSRVSLSSSVCCAVCHALAAWRPLALPRRRFL